jgi:membrane-bound inhibitor of C-type lysozyme
LKVGELKKLIANLPANAEVKATITYNCNEAEKEIKINNAKVKAENVNGNNYKTVILNINI